MCVQFKAGESIVLAAVTVVDVEATAVVGAVPVAVPAVEVLTVGVAAVPRTPQDGDRVAAVVDVVAVAVPVTAVSVGEVVVVTEHVGEHRRVVAVATGPPGTRSGVALGVE